MKLLNRRFLVALLTVVLTLGCLFPAAYAWFANLLKFGTPEITGSSRDNYFASGTGSEDDPYILTEPIHIYNLSWLQNANYFDDKTYFKLGNTIDMTKIINGTQQISGAVPPIGSTDNPFKGNFDGQGYTISNLWVSSDPTDWKERPTNLDLDTISQAVGNDIGMFGSIVKDDANSDIHVANFFLENIVVSTTTTADTSSVGIIAGNLDGRLENVGVTNAVIYAKDQAKLYSECSLIGRVGESVPWAGKPDSGLGGSGGNLEIKPSSDSEIQAAINNLSSSSSAAVPGAIEGTAYFKKTISYGTVNGPLQNLYLCKDAIVFPDSGDITVTESDHSWQRTASESDGKEMYDFYTHYTSYQNSAAYISFNAQPGITNGNTVTPIATGQKIDDLANCVWFKPQISGVCALAFVHENNSTNDYMSVFRFLRDSNDNITNLQEMKFELTSGRGNKSVNYYGLTISKEDVEKGYEYAIGARPSTDKKGNLQSTTFNSKFFYLMLAGSDESQGTIPTEGKGKALLNIDYLYEPGTPETIGTIFPETEPRTMRSPLIALNGVAAENTEISYWVASDASDAEVLYHLEGTNVVSQNAGESQSLPTTDFFSDEKRWRTQTATQ